MSRAGEVFHKGEGSPEKEKSLKDIPDASSREYYLKQHQDISSSSVVIRP